ncbi:Aste57867_13723 [Aphanomyces stellatus]|uniref:Aste57867_13723 protein n=1 Tax=Aphanomyces stellatus TaxID=120398 RepID=A0A485KZ83_9STRA|nr:hypothetical protein As57867_013673 [Aphanomyces stellatus]VFT90556.1 Aste57867_13723 [Aphanomyces stellatus]
MGLANTSNGQPQTANVRYMNLKRRLRAHDGEPQNRFSCVDLAMRTLLLLVVAMLASGLNSTNSTSSSDTLQAFLAPMLPGLRTALPSLVAGAIPLAYGNCLATDKPAPRPCTATANGADLFLAKGFLYKVRARWIAGLSTFSVARLDVVFEPSGAMVLTLALAFDALPMSVQVSACVGDYCGAVLDSTDTCCGANKTLTVAARIPCFTTAPFLRTPTIRSVAVTPPVNAVLTFGLGSLSTKLDVWDLTPTFVSVLRNQVESVLLSTGLGALNNLLTESIGDTVECRAL